MNTVDKYKKTSLVASIVAVVFKRAQGTQVFDQNGRFFPDCFSGISVTNAGHSNPRIVAAAKAQIGKSVHCYSYVYNNQPMADLAEKLTQITPSTLKKTLFTDRVPSLMRAP